MRVWRNGRRISDQLSSFNYESAAGTEDVTTLNDDVETMAATGLLDRIWAGVGWYDDPIDAAMRAAGSRMTWCYGAADGARAVHSERAGQYSYKTVVSARSACPRRMVREAERRALGERIFPRPRRRLRAPGDDDAQHVAPDREKLSRSRQLTSGRPRRRRKRGSSWLTFCPLPGPAGRCVSVS